MTPTPQAIPVPRVPLLVPRPRPNRSSGSRPARPTFKARPARPAAGGRKDTRGPKWGNHPTPNARPGKPFVKPADRASDRPSGRPAGGPTGRPTSKPGSRPTGKPPFKRGPKPADFKPRPAADAVESRASGIRLQRVMADAGVASRRDCEEMIEDGRVEVNGSIVTTLPIFVNPATDRISVDGQLLPRSDRAARRVYVMLNKPDNTLGTTRDDLEYKKGGRRTVTDLVQHSSGARLYPVGRLDFHSTGLVLMTNDGELADRLTHARYGVTKTFRVWVNGAVRPDIVEMLRRRIGKKDATDSQGRPNGGVHIVNDDEEHHGRRPPRQSHPSHSSNQRSEKVGAVTTIIEIQIRDGKTDPLDEMLLTAGVRIRRIARTAIGPLKLMGVRPGEWRDLTKDELRSLKEAAGLHEQRPARPPRIRPAQDAPESTDQALPATPSSSPSAPIPADDLSEDDS
jgi:23S rRNA pseudouridine2605 synthase